MKDLPADYMERQARWVKRMQDAGVLPRPAQEEPLAPPPPEGQWSMTSQPGGMVFVQLNKVPVSPETALEFMKLRMETQ